MAQTIVRLDDHEDQIVTIIKGKYGLNNKSDAIRFVIDQFEKELLEPELRPEYMKKLQKIEKNGKFKRYNSINDLRKQIEHA